MAINLLDSRLEESLGDDTELLTIGECYTELAAIHQRMNQPTEAIDLLKKGLHIYKKLPQQMNATAGKFQCIIHACKVRSGSICESDQNAPNFIFIDFFFII